MPAIDAARLIELQEDLGGDPGLFKQILRSFLDEAPQQLAEGRQASRDGRAQGVHEAYHSLKSTSATVGAMTFSALCKEIELAARGGTVLDPEKFDRADRLFEEARRELEARL